MVADEVLAVLAVLAEAARLTDTALLGRRKTPQPFSLVFPHLAVSAILAKRSISPGVVTMATPNSR